MPFRPCSAALPLLQELQLAGASLLPPHGERLLQGLVAGAAGSLRHLNLSRQQLQRRSFHAGARVSADMA
jgi:hypothetical protein